MANNAEKSNEQSWMIIPAKHRDDYKTFFINGSMGFGSRFFAPFCICANARSGFFVCLVLGA
jgi:hypothetical protein